MMIVVAIALSCVLHKTIDIIVMTSLLLLNGTISFHETRKAPSNTTTTSEPCYLLLGL